MHLNFIDLLLASSSTRAHFDLFPVKPFQIFSTKLRKSELIIFMFCPMNCIGKMSLILNKIKLNESMFEVKMAGYCPSSFLLLFMDLKNAKKNEKRPQKTFSYGTNAVNQDSCHVACSWIQPYNNGS